MKSPLELFRELELEVRTPKERLPIDTFLPAPESLPSDFPEPPPAPTAVHTRELGTVDDETAREEEMRRKRRRSRRARRPEGQDPAKSLEQEVQEFMSRTRPALLEDEDVAELTNGLDPNEVPGE